MEVNQIRIKGSDDTVRVCVEKHRGKVHIRTYTFKTVKRFKGDTGYHLLVLEGARVVKQGWAWNLEDAMEWLEAHTGGGLSVD